MDNIQELEEELAKIEREIEFKRKSITMNFPACNSGELERRRLVRKAYDINNKLAEIHRLTGKGTSRPYQIGS